MQVGEAAGVPVVDLWRDLQGHPHWREFFTDGLHLSDSGNAEVFDLVQKHIDRELPQATPDAVALDMPLHGDLTADNYKTVLQAYL